MASQGEVLPTEGGFKVSGVAGCELLWGALLAAHRRLAAHDGSCRRGPLLGAALPLRCRLPSLPTPATDPG